MKTMTQSTFLSGMLVMGLLSVQSFQSVQAAELTADITVFQNNQGSIAPRINFSSPESGDLYLAFRVNGEGAYYFLNSSGSITGQASAYASLSDYSGEYPVPEFNTAAIANGRYQLYMVMVNSGGYVYDINNWIGGFSGLQKINFSLGGAEISDLDSNADGWFDDDLNKDGFHDSDSNFDGWYDDDLDRDGFSDGSSNTLNTTSSSNATDTGSNSSGSTTSTTTISSISRGLATYSSYCEACHGTDPTRNRDGILSAGSASATARAIQRNEGGMGFLDFLSDTDLQDIADYINSL